ncbi:MAG: class I SAM-dependent methyltransferase [Chitinophagales bacterium]|nr:class I SAM-dependent methyltransferase [Chitinophagales bacterium]
MSIYKIEKTSERMIPERAKGFSEELMLIRHLFVYEHVKNALGKDYMILDLGCGVGYGTFLLAKKVKKILGIDISREAVSYANLKYSSANCEFRSYDGVHIDCKDESFDAIVSFQVIEHVENDYQFISEVHRILKPGGAFYLTTPNKSIRLYPKQKPWNRYHLREYYSHELKELLKSSFTNVAIKGISASLEIMEYEYMRIHKIQKDLNSCMNFMPTKLKSILSKSIRVLGLKDNMGDKFLEKRDLLSIDNFYLIDEDLHRSLDLYAECYKSKNTGGI